MAGITGNEVAELVCKCVEKEERFAASLCKMTGVPEYDVGTTITCARGPAEESSIVFTPQTRRGGCGGTHTDLKRKN